MQASERMFTINGAASCVAVQGGEDDPTVLLIGSSMLSWPDELCERLVAGGRRVIRYDVRDTGRSEAYPPGKPGYCLANLVDDAVGVLDATATKRAHVAGMSTGGWIAQLLALGHPERVATLTLIASRPNPPGPVDEDLPGHDAALMEVIVNTPEPDWSDERAVVDHLVLQARTLAGAGAFDEASARATPRPRSPDHRRPVRDDQHRIRRPRPALARAARRDQRADARAARRGRPVLPDRQRRGARRRDPGRSSRPARQRRAPAPDPRRPGRRGRVLAHTAD